VEICETRLWGGLGANVGLRRGLVFMVGRLMMRNQQWAKVKPIG